MLTANAHAICQFLHAIAPYLRNPILLCTISPSASAESSLMLIGSSFAVSTRPLAFSCLFSPLSFHLSIHSCFSFGSLSACVRILIEPSYSRGRCKIMPQPLRLVYFWWSRAEELHHAGLDRCVHVEGVVRFQARVVVY